MYILLILILLYSGFQTFRLNSFQIFIVNASNVFSEITYMCDRHMYFVCIYIHIYSSITYICTSRILCRHFNSYYYQLMSFKVFFATNISVFLNNNRRVLIFEYLCIGSYFIWLALCVLISTEILYGIACPYVIFKYLIFGRIEELACRVIHSYIYMFS